MSFNNSATIISDKPFFITWVFCVPILMLHIRTLATELGVTKPTKTAERVFYAAVMLALIAMFYVSTRSFIYFQF
ncbi:MAG: hypothetical protein ACI8ZV_001502 [Chitinophagales bacterium]|jgi:hypothetical protein